MVIRRPCILRIGIAVIVVGCAAGAPCTRPAIPNDPHRTIEFGVQENATTPPATPGSTRLRPAFVVSVERDGEWTGAGSIPCNRFYAARTLELSTALGTGPVRIRISPRAGGRAHVDEVTLNGHAPTASSTPDLTKLLKVDFDVVEAPAAGLELVFEAVSAPAKLELTARVEPPEIATAPFQFPPRNTFRETTLDSAFYTYHLGARPGRLTVDGELANEALGEPLFSERIPCTSGHPQGATTGWVRNDEEALYVAIDFTPDNTCDGDADYAEVFVARAGELRSYRVTASDQRWGRAGFTPTERAPYPHKTYELALPLAELREPGANELRLAFATYGTASPGADGNDPLAFEPQSQTWAMVYYDVPVDQFRLVVQLYDAAGSTIGVPIPLFSAGYTPPTAAVAADPLSSAFLVVWLDPANQRILGRKVYPNGSTAPAAVELSDLSPGDDPGNPRLAFDDGRSRYLVVWQDRRAGAGLYHHLYGRFVGADGQPQGAGSFAIDDENVDATIIDSDLAYNPDDNQYLVVWEAYSEIRAQRINAVDGGFVGASIELGPDGDNRGTGVAYSRPLGGYMVSWVDYASLDLYARPVWPDGTTGSATAVVTTGNLDSPRIAAHPTVPRLLAAVEDTGVYTVRGRWLRVLSNTAVGLGNELELTTVGAYPSGLGAQTRPSTQCSMVATVNGNTHLPVLAPANGISVTSAPATTSELGQSATLGISLCAQPSATVVVNVASGDPSEGTVSPNSLSFSTSDWADEQQVTVSPVSDGIPDGTVTYLVGLGVNDAASPDDYDTIIGAAAITNLDVDVLFSDGFESGGTDAWSNAMN